MNASTPMRQTSAESSGTGDVTRRPEADGGSVQTLSAGAHIDQQAGVCLLELASICAGERFSDRPRCVQPTLSSLCRLVNDGVDDPTRQTLVGFIPDIVRTRSTDPRLDPLVVLACVSYAERFDATRRLARHHRRAERLVHRLDARSPGRLQSLRVLIYQGLWVERALTDAATVVWHEGEENLVNMLACGLAACLQAENNNEHVYTAMPDAALPWVVDGDVDRLERLITPHLGVSSPASGDAAAALVSKR